MKNFEHPLDYQKFSFLIRDKRRDPNGSTCQNFLESLLATCKTRISETPEKTKLWRAQLGRDKTIVQFAGGSIIDTSLKPFQPHRMKPHPEKVSEGRANPGGVPVLYLSTKRDTAMAECRPWMAAYISIGTFYTVRNLKIIDLSKDEFIPIGIDDIKRKKDDHEFVEKMIWGELNRAFTKPVQRSESSKDYLPTQRIAEFFKNHSIDGLKYKSALGEGSNIALFDLSAAEQADCSLFEVKNISYLFAPIKGAKYKTTSGYNKINCEDT